MMKMSKSKKGNNKVNTWGVSARSMAYALTSPVVSKSAANLHGIIKAYGVISKHPECISIKCEVLASTKETKVIQRKKQIKLINIFFTRVISIG